MIKKVAIKGDKLVPRVIEAIYEGGVLKPAQPLDISEHTRVQITIDPQDEPRKKAEHILALARQSCEGLKDIGVRSQHLTGKHGRGTLVICLINCMPNYKLKMLKKWGTRHTAVA